MQLIKWDDPLSLRSQMDEVFNQFFNSAPVHSSALSTAMDIYNEGDETLVVEMQAPGFNQDEVDVSIHNGMLEIKGEKTIKEEEGDKKRTYMMRESSASFYRRVALPKNVDTDKIAAHFEDGSLRVTLPYKELPTPKRIQIHSPQKDSKKSK